MNEDPNEVSHHSHEQHEIHSKEAQQQTLTCPTLDQNNHQNGFACPQISVDQLSDLEGIHQNSGEPQTSSDSHAGNHHSGSETLEWFQ